MRELELDIEECDEKTLFSILQSLPNLKKLRLFHLEKFYPEAGVELHKALRIAGLVELTLTKCYNIPMGQIMSSVGT